MKLGQLPRLLASVAGAALLRRPAPLMVGWAVTNRCNLRCSYCRAYEQVGDELDAATCLHLLEEMVAAGVVRVQFTGGEPLLRDDLSELLTKARSLGLFTTVSTNGYLVPDRASELCAVGRVNLSLDGEKQNHDALRGEGSFDAITHALQALHRVEIPFKFVTVLNRRNLGDIPFMLELASKNNTAVLFQPALPEMLRSSKQNPEAPEVADYRKALDELMAAKRAGRPVANSFPALRHLRNWPDAVQLTCVGGLVFCRLRPDGTMVHCPRGPQSETGAPNAAELGFSAAFRGLQRRKCDGCWSAPVVEAACIFAAKPGAVLNLMNGSV